MGIFLPFFKNHISWPKDTKNITQILANMAQVVAIIMALYLICYEKSF